MKSLATHNQQTGSGDRPIVPYKGGPATDYPLSWLSYWQRLSGVLKGEPIGPIKLRDKFGSQYALRAQVSNNKQLSLQFPWQIDTADFAQIYATGPVSTPLASTWDLLNKPFT